MPDSQLRLYIRYFFQMKVVDLSKTKKGELKRILTLLLEEYYATKMKELGDYSSLVDINGGHLVE